MEMSATWSRLEWWMHLVSGDGAEWAWGEKERREAGAGCSLVEEKQVRKQTAGEEGRGRAVQRSFCVG